MRFTDRTFKSLVILNTGAVFLIALVSVFYCVDNRWMIQRRLEALFTREWVVSRFAAAMDPVAGGESVAYPTYQIKISPTNMRRFQVQVEDLKKAGTMTDDLKLWLPAKFYHGAEEYKVKVRLRGDLPYHWVLPKKSWRIRFDKEKLFEGRRSIELIVPVDKAYEIEKVSYDVARELGLLVPDAGFCGVQINGVDYGRYLWIERYGKEMLEKQGYPLGEIFRERNVWIQTRTTRFGINPIHHTANFINAVRKDVDAGYDAHRWDRLVTLMREADDATFRREIPHLLNLEKYLSWNALTWTFGSTHAHWGDNLRWYYDNTSGLFEPILYDVNRYSIRITDAQSKAYNWWRFEASETDRLARRVMQVPAYRQRRNEILWRLVNDDRFDLARRCDEYFQHLRSGWLTGVGAAEPEALDDFHTDTITILDDNRKDLRDHLAFARIFATPTLVVDGGVPALRLHLLPDSRGAIRLEHLSLTFADARWSGIGSEGVRITLLDPEGMEHAVEPPRISQLELRTMDLAFDDLTVWTPVDPSLRQVTGEWTLRIEFPGIDLARWKTPGFVASIRARFRNSISGEPLSDLYTMIFPLVYAFENEEASPITWPVERFIAHSGLPFVLDAGVLVLPEGEYLVERNMTVPAGYGIRLEAGVVLRMAPGVSVVCHGPLEVSGTDDKPVRIIPDRPGSPWGSFAVVRSDKPSHVYGLEVEGGSEAHLGGLFLSGQLCFYGSDVTLERCVLSGARADDSLNIKKATFSITDCVFQGNLSDAFDGDWVRGTVTSSIFIGNGGDGIDLSGSSIVVRDSLLAHMGDKAVSAGEKSDVVAFNCVFRDSAIGVASKDLSRVDLYSCVFLRNRSAIELYRKKQIFGGGTGRVVGSLFWGNAKAVTTDTESSFEGVAIGVDDWQTTGHVSVTELLRGDPKRYYAGDGSGNVLHDPATVATSPFRITASTGPSTFGELSVPDLAGVAVGLYRPLAIGAEHIELIRGFDDR